MRMEEEEKVWGGIYKRGLGREDDVAERWRWDPDGEVVFVGPVSEGETEHEDR